MWAFWILFPSFPLPVTLFRIIPFYDLTIDRLSGKICTFAHVTSVYFATSKVTKEAEILQEGFSLIFIPLQKSLDRTKSNKIRVFHAPTPSKDTQYDRLGSH